MSQRTTKAAIRRARTPAKTRISLCIRAVRSVFSDRMCLLQSRGYQKRDEQEVLSYWVDIQANAGHMGLIVGRRAHALAQMCLMIVLHVHVYTSLRFHNAHITQRPYFTKKYM